MHPYNPSVGHPSHCTPSKLRSLSQTESTREGSSSKSPGQHSLSFLRSPQDPEKEKIASFGDRFIPARENTDTIGNFLEISKSLSTDVFNFEAQKQNDSCFMKRIYKEYLKETMLQDETVQELGYQSEKRRDQRLRKKKGNRMLKFKINQKKKRLNSQRKPEGSFLRKNMSSLVQKHISQIETGEPYRTLEAPGLQEDFYLNLLDWSCDNLIGVLLGQIVYLWDHENKQVNDVYRQAAQDAAISSLSFTPDGRNVLLGDEVGKVRLVDIETSKVISCSQLHTSRIGIIKPVPALGVDQSLASISHSGLQVSPNLVACGSHDCHISINDTRTLGRKRAGVVTGPQGSTLVDSQIARFRIHDEEVCGLAWECDGLRLASGGNDNKLGVWDLRKGELSYSLRQHKAAIKGVAWDPESKGKLYSGGGNHDNLIKIFDVERGVTLEELEVDSQVTGLIFSWKTGQLGSLHGFSTNSLQLWGEGGVKKGSKPVKVFKGHEKRVLYYALGPNGEDIVTGAGDQTLRYWKVFEKARRSDTSSSILGGSLGIGPSFQCY